MAKERECDGCGREALGKHLGRINGKYLCKKCRVSVRKNHRKETLESSEDKERIKEIDRELDRESNKKQYEKRKLKNPSPPKIKGSKKTRVDKNHCYITFEEKKNWFRILLKRGLNDDEAKERVNNLVRSQRELVNKMVEQKKSESEIKIKQQELLEELWNF